MGLDGEAGTPEPGLTNQLAARAEHDTADRLGPIAARPSCAAAASTASPRRPTASSWPRPSPAPGSQLFDGGHGFFMQDAAAIPAIIDFLAGGTAGGPSAPVDCPSWT